MSMYEAYSKAGLISGNSGSSGGGSSDPNAVKYTAQSKSEEQKAVARNNIGAVDSDYVDEQTNGLQSKEIVDEDDSLLAQYIPCVDDNGVACYYDVVTEETFYNEGNDTLLYGSIIV